MSQQKDKSPEQVSDEDYKVAPTSADSELVGNEAVNGDEKKKQVFTSGANYRLSDDKLLEELKEGALLNGISARMDKSTPCGQSTIV